MSSTHPGQAPLAGARLLVADDHADGAELLQMMLEAAGATVRTAGSGREVLELVAAFEPDVFLLDITLPDMTGYELLDALRADPRYARTPAVAVTGHEAEQDRSKASSTGFAVHVLKPFDRTMLLETIARLMKRA